MDFKNRSWSCYPRGSSESRRGFLMAVAAAAAAARMAVPDAVSAQEEVGAEPLPDFPEGGFPRGSVQLNFNENPLGPSPKAIHAVITDGLASSNRYNYIDPVIQAIARHHAVDPKRVLIGCGSTEFLQFVPWALLKDGGNVVLPVPTYGWCGGVAESMGRAAIRVPLVGQGEVDVEGLERAITGTTKMVYVSNPNNPTGSALGPTELRRIMHALPRGAVFFVDEAYHDFLPEGASGLSLVAEGAPVLVARTFSKAYGLAGLRLGYVIGPDEVIDRVKAVWWGDLGINAAAHLAGPAALGDHGHVSRYVSTIDEGLTQLRGGLSALGLEPYPHRAPFFMVDLKRPARRLVESLNRQRIFVKDGASWGMPSFLRVSVGTPGDNDKFLSAFSDLMNRDV